MKNVLSPVCIAFLLSACGEPFPNMTGLSESFSEYREQVTALEAMLDESAYDVVDLRGDTVTGHWFEGAPYDGQVAEQERPENADRWAELLTDVKATSIERYDNGELWLPIDHDYLDRDFQGNASYVSSQNIQTEIKQCERKFSNVRCGQCIVGLEDDWWLVYRWTPSDISDEIFDDWQEGRITEEEAYQAQSEIIDACLSDGGTFVGESASE